MFDAKSLLNMVMGAGQQAGQSGGLGGMLGGLMNQAQQGAQGAQGAAGGLAGMVGSVLSQAAQGLQQGGRDLNQASGGMGDKLRDMAGQASGGRSPQDLMQQAKDMIANNPGLAAAAAAGLGGILLGTKGGRGLAMGAAKLGGLALIGGLAYSAYQNYQAGKPLMNANAPVHAAPQGSGFAEGDGDDQERALLMVRAMIAAAAADGIIDNAERSRIIGNLKQAGLDDEANAFLDNEFRNPLDAQGLVDMAGSAEMAAQIYTAARLAIDPDTQEEQDFLANLSSGLGLEADLVAHIDAAASSVVENQGA
ncbi:MAG: tellurite resistance TerB family protein [Beijerinckiaceae bacterium]